MAEITIDAPAVPKGRGGLLSVVTPQSGDPAALYYGLRYQAPLCGASRRYVEGENKEFDQRSIVVGKPFTVYRGIEASLFQRDESIRLTQEAFDGAASNGIEQGFQEFVLNHDDAEDITPTAGTAVTNARQAVGLLEQYAAERYSGLPIIHGNKFATALIPELQVDRATWKQYTANGTPVASGGGYSADGPGSASAADGTAWLYITGNVHIWQGAAGASPIQAPDLKKNRDLVLMENTYITTADCFVAAILVGT